MENFLDFLKAPFEADTSIAYTVLFYCAAAAVLLSLIGIIATLASRKKQKKIIKAQAKKLSDIESKMSAYEAKLQSVENKLDLINNSVCNVKDEVRTVVDQCNRQLTAALINNFPTREEKHKADLFDRFGNLFTADTDRLERVVNILKDENL